MYVAGKGDVDVFSFSFRGLNYYTREVIRRRLLKILLSWKNLNYDNENKNIRSNGNIVNRYPRCSLEKSIYNKYCVRNVDIFIYLCEKYRETIKDSFCRGARKLIC